MFFSNKEFVAACLSPQGMNGQSSGDIYTVQRMIRAGAKAKDLENLFSEVKRSILNRDSEFEYTFKGQPYHIYTGKWFRPWDVVPSLREFAPPTGDYGVGVEVEIGFNTLTDARRIIGLISRWRHVAVDFEGPAQPAEVTFPPVLYSKFGSTSKPCKYLKILSANADSVYRHGVASYTGTHINVSKGGVQRINDHRRDAVVGCLIGLRSEEERKYFGRDPYGYANIRATPTGNHYVEYKLFNSTKDWRVLRRYVDIAVALTDIITSEDTPINNYTVREALELGYNKHTIKEQNNAN